MLAEGRPGLWELGIWAALREVNPWGPMRADQRAAIGHALFANAHRDPARRSMPFRPREFMPYLPMDPEERDRVIAEGIVAALAPLEGGKKGAELKAWRRERRARVGRAKA